MSTRSGLYPHWRDASPSEQVLEGPWAGDLVPRVECLEQRRLYRADRFPEEAIGRLNSPGPQVVTASRPPGRTSRHISAMNAFMSAAKKTPKTHMTASKPPAGSPVQVASPWRKSILDRPSLAARVMASSSNGCATSTPSTRPVAPTTRAAGIVDAPWPQHRSSTVPPGPSRSLDTVSAPNRSQKASGARP